MGTELRVLLLPLALRTSAAERQTDRQTDIQTDRQTDRETDRQRDRQTERKKEKKRGMRGERSEGRGHISHVR